jgi:hypothetical protein
MLGTTTGHQWQDAIDLRPALRRSPAVMGAAELNTRWFSIKANDADQFSRVVSEVKPLIFAGAIAIAAPSVLAGFAEIVRAWSEARPAAKCLPVRRPKSSSRRTA